LIIKKTEHQLSKVNPKYHLSIKYFINNYFNLGEILKRCKHFKALDELLGDKPQFNPPYVHHSGRTETITHANEDERGFLEQMEDGAENNPLIISAENSGGQNQLLSVESGIPQGKPRLLKIIG
jgi:hypothetical protein